MDFDLAFDRLIGHEGGYVSAESAKRNNDPGGETKFGISKRSYPNEDIAGLTLDRAKELYRRDYWNPAGCDAVPDAIKYPLFDFAVNSGVKRAAMFLQKVVGAFEDGSIGPKTLMAINSMDVHRLVSRFYGHRLEFMTGLSNWPENSRGWSRRIAAELMAS